ncbi:MAG TPA: ABC transporter substrate-binding protein [Desulfobulbus sp.]|nr:ABC transporter substrate-binding protein [Desulfobulbus sp.]
MKKTIVCILAIVLNAVLTHAGEPVKIGMITTLSTKAGYLGEEIRDGFKLAVTQENGRLGGIPVQLLIGDDGRCPEKGRQLAERFIKKEKAKILTGIVFSNVAMAVVPKVVRQGIFFISPNAGPSQLAGKGCHKNYFNVSWQTDNLSEVIGQYAMEQGYKNVYIIAPNYLAGKDNVAGFKRFYKGKITGEVYTTLGQADYAAEIAALRSAAPDAVYFFLPGGMGINFLKQYARAGLTKKIPLLGPAATDERVLQAVGEAAVGVINSSQWCADFQTPANAAFVDAFEKTYGRIPTLFASQGYDTARLIGSALAAVGGDVSRMDEFRAALEKADFTSVRGAFRFGPNHFPIQDFYVRQVVKKQSGGYANKLLKKVFNDHQDAYVGQCVHR